MTLHSDYFIAGSTISKFLKVVRHLPNQQYVWNHRWFEDYVKDFWRENVSKNQTVISGCVLSESATDTVSCTAGEVVIDGTDVTVQKPNDVVIAVNGWTVFYIDNTGTLQNFSLTSETVQGANAPDSVVLVGFARRQTPAFSVYSIRNREKPKALGALERYKSTGMIVPLYIYPADIYNNTTYNSLMGYARQYADVPVIAILNPAVYLFPTQYAIFINQGLTYTAVAAGNSGADVTVELIDPQANGVSLSVAVTNLAIEVTLATDGGGAITSDADAVKAAVNGYGPAAALLAVTGSGATPLVVLAATNLSFVDGNYTTAIRRLKGAGITVIGYISTAYTVTTLQVSKDQIDDWTRYYPEIDGIFADEMDNADLQVSADYYRELKEYSRDFGYSPFVTNPGTTYPAIYHKNKVADIIIAFECAEFAFPTEAVLEGGATPDSYSEYDKKHRGGIFHTWTTQFSATDPNVLLAKKHLGWVYFTDDVMPNPWDALPFFLEDQFKILSNKEPKIYLDHIWGTSAQVASGDATFYTDGSGNPLNAVAGSVTINEDDKILIAHNVTSTANMMLICGGKKVRLEMVKGVNWNLSTFNLTLGETGDSFSGDIELTGTGTLTIEKSNGFRVYHTAMTVVNIAGDVIVNNNNIPVAHWTYPDIKGSGLSISSIGYPVLTSLNGTDVAFIDANLDELRTYRFNGSTWGLVGSGLSIAGVGIAALAALNGTDVAFIDDVSDELRTYKFNGSTWILVGSGLSLSAVGYPALTSLNGTDVAIIDNTSNKLRTYRFKGSTWILVGSGLSLSALGYPALTSLNGTDVAFIESTSSELRTYRFGYSLSVPHSPFT